MDKGRGVSWPLVGFIVLLHASAQLLIVSLGFYFWRDDLFSQSMHGCLTILGYVVTLPVALPLLKVLPYIEQHVGHVPGGVYIAILGCNSVIVAVIIAQVLRHRRANS